MINFEDFDIEEQDKNLYDFIIDEKPTDRINGISVLYSATRWLGYGLIDAMRLYDNIPTAVTTQNSNKHILTRMKNILERNGFKCSIKRNSVNESLKISDYKKYIVYANKDIYDSYKDFFKLFPDHDKGYNRIYFNVDIKFENAIPQNVIDYILFNGYRIDDQEKGIMSDFIGRRGKIGKYLARHDKDLLKVYNDSMACRVKNTDDLQVVISRHPYDIIGMSTDRGWTTCLDLYDKRYGGQHLHNIKRILKNGDLISYMIRKDDKNINKPMSRVIISRTHNGNISPSSHVYGVRSTDFRNFVYDWCELYNNYNGDIISKQRLDSFIEDYST